MTLKQTEEELVDGTAEYQSVHTFMPNPPCPSCLSKMLTLPLHSAQEYEKS